ncbi:MAG: hypothetical protein HN509_09930 [Halobacteriovoraceae bacterium]|jgi:hypothetical protein|nr:hypothetical protein [Halobacteriovoraceae bacterium]MBT5094730.1 hypothetical protein [Halobacteriovoraceae bacterium]
MALNSRILYICPTQSWGSRERWVIKNCKILKEKGVEIYLYCSKGSFLEEKAKEVGVSLIYHQGKIDTKFLRWHKLFNIPAEIKLKKINLVHCFDLRFLWPLCFFLRGNPLIPMVYSQLEETSKKYHQVWHKLLINRLDLVILPTWGLAGNIEGHLGVGFRKMKFLGMGIANSTEGHLKNLPSRALLNGDSKDWCLGVHVPVRLKEEGNVYPLLYALESFNSGRSQRQKKAKLYLISEKDWNFSPLFEGLMKLVQELRLVDHVVFYHDHDVSQVQLGMDLWVGISPRDVLEDYALEAMMRGIPILVPRTMGHMELLRRLGPVGETYSIGDARELRTQLGKLFKGYKKYHRNILKSIDKVDLNEGKDYPTELIESYHLMLRGRERLSRRKKFLDTIQE